MKDDARKRVASGDHALSVAQGKVGDSSSGEAPAGDDFLRDLHRIADPQRLRREIGATLVLAAQAEQRAAAAAILEKANRLH